MIVSKIQNFFIGFILTLILFVSEGRAQPNVVIFFLDDSGYADFSPFGKDASLTPHVEKLANEGMRFHQFYVPQAICSASRAALLTGCYPGRTKVFGAHGPKERGLEPEFATIAEVLKANGYATGHFGKWHCGDQPETRPLARGFDEHAGLMYSNDMWRFHPTAPEKWGKHPLQFWDNGQVKIHDVSKADQTQFTTWITEYSVDFIQRQASSKQPFFLYLAHPMPHVPLFVSDRFKGKSGKGLYGDVIMELDWSLGQIMSALDEAGVGENTIVIFSSDNGPWSGYGNHAGKTPFREHKATSFDGGTRSATIIKYAGKLPAGNAFNKPVSSMDILPTLAHLTGAKLPSNEIDGKNIWPYLTGQTTDNPQPYYAFSTGKHLECIISSDGKWKMHLPHQYRHVLKPGKDGNPGKHTQKSIELSLFNLEEDPYESINVIQQYPDVADRLKTLLDQHASKFYSK